MLEGVYEKFRRIGIEKHLSGQIIKGFNNGYSTLRVRLKLNKNSRFRGCQKTEIQKILTAPSALTPKTIVHTPILANALRLIFRATLATRSAET